MHINICHESVNPVPNLSLVIAPPPSRSIYTRRLLYVTSMLSVNQCFSRLNPRCSWTTVLHGCVVVEFRSETENSPDQISPAALFPDRDTAVLSDHWRPLSLFPVVSCCRAAIVSSCAPLASIELVGVGIFVETSLESLFESCCNSPACSCRVCHGQRPVLVAGESTFFPVFSATR